MCSVAVHVQRLKLSQHCPPIINICSRIEIAQHMQTNKKPIWISKRKILYRYPKPREKPHIGAWANSLRPVHLIAITVPPMFASTRTRRTLFKSQRKYWRPLQTAFLHRFTNFTIVVPRLQKPGCLKGRHHAARKECPTFCNCFVVNSQDQRNTRGLMLSKPP